MTPLDPELVSSAIGAIRVVFMKLLRSRPQAASAHVRSSARSAWGGSLNMAHASRHRTATLAPWGRGALRSDRRSVPAQFFRCVFACLGFIVYRRVFVLRLIVLCFLFWVCLVDVLVSRLPIVSLGSLLFRCDSNQ